MTQTPTQTTDSLYSVLPMEGPYEVAIGRALITMIEPDVGNESGYNRWYEDEHFYSGAMAHPWLFAGRRWVAPRDLQALRYPEDSAIAQPLSAGKYISVYWITAGRYDDHSPWSRTIRVRSEPDGRFPATGFSHVCTAYQIYKGAVYRDAHGPRDIHALNYPYQGLVVEIVDASKGREPLQEWLRDEYLPARLAGSPVAMTLMFEFDPARRDVQSKPNGLVQDRVELPGMERFVTLLSFTEMRPPEGWDPHFVRAGDAIAASGLGRVVLAAPFIPTLPGTDIYVDQLR